MLPTRSHLGWMALAALVTTIAAVCGSAMAGAAGRDRHKPADRHRHVLVVRPNTPRSRALLTRPSPGAS